MLRESEHWQIVRPPHSLTEGHVALVMRHPNHGGHLTVNMAADLIATYRIARGGLHAVLGCDGFALSFAHSWQPYGRGIGEPSADWGHRPTIHVFGRSRTERLKPIRVMALPVHDRQAPISPTEQAELDRQLTIAFANADTTNSPVILHTTDPSPCDGCAPEVERDQELWRSDGVRAIRPRQPLLDANILVMPLRHVESPGSLHAHEIVSYAERLREVRAQFARRYGASGLSCFLNDGTRAGQETPHVHVFGRAVDEPQNPFELLAQRLRAR